MWNLWLHVGSVVLVVSLFTRSLGESFVASFTNCRRQSRLSRSTADHPGRSCLACHYISIWGSLP
jgi:hypothetical protein